jgi:hypothetical protein
LGGAAPTTPQGEIKLSDLKWRNATTGWGEVSTQHAAGGGAMKVDGKAVTYGIAAHAPSLIEFDLPKGATRFQTFAALDDGGASQPKGATVRFRVFTQSPHAENKTGNVTVNFQDLGFKAARVRDLWVKKDLGTLNEFAPTIAPHGAGLYCLSPQ